jgi:predicted  nucleic acid-binding Zn-ribbon protein
MSTRSASDAPVTSAVAQTKTITEQLIDLQIALETKKTLVNDYVTELWTEREKLEDNLKTARAEAESVKTFNAISTAEKDTLDKKIEDLTRQAQEHTSTYDKAAKMIGDLRKDINAFDAVIVGLRSSKR